MPIAKNSRKVTLFCLCVGVEIEEELKRMKIDKEFKVVNTCKELHVSF